MESVVVSYFSQNPDQKFLELLKEEHREISAAWEQSKDPNKQGYFKIEHLDRPFAQQDQIPNDVATYGDKIVLFHFAGHAGQQKIVLENGDGQLPGFSLLLAKASNLKLVFLNGCGTHDQVDLLFERSKVKAIIATSQEIPDSVAKDFATDFYRQIAKTGVTIQAAFDFAKGKLLFKGQATGGYTENAIVWRGLGTTTQRQGLDLWKLHVREGAEAILTDPYWWVIGDLALTRVINLPIPKMFFIYDELSKNEYNTFIDELTPKIDNGEVVVNGTFNIQEQLNIVSVNAEINAADIVFIMIKDKQFYKFWQSLQLKVDDFKGKFIVFVKISDPDYCLEKFKKDNLEANAIIPSNKWAYIHPLIGDVDDKMKKLLFAEVYNEFIRDVIDVLPKYIDDFNFKDPKKDFKKSLQSSQSNIIFACLEGTPNCGHNLLLKKFIKELSKTTKSIKKINLSFRFNHTADIDELEKVISKELGTDDNCYISIKNINSQESVIIIFDDLLPPSNVVDANWKEPVELVSKFLDRLSDKLPQKIINKVVVIAIHRQFDTNSIFNSIIGNTPVANIQKVSCTMKSLEKDEIVQWREDVDPGGSILTNLDPENLQVQWPGYLIPVLTEMGKQLQIPSKLLAKIID
ncbi:CHAT domain-containing protein [Dyadobacter sp. CY261]|uniref:CHAT domain-containing protein n=1 Tax=Dyadobacter sp. CY261 TaxID=2907203 RepID=UPI001F2039B2|nr:CHAT domain-containing protein [Dyadobacter sp. CY261]MCF0072926.1 CHAT domain-containing protein [Dyadobacter sp. CY261]